MKKNRHNKCLGAVMIEFAITIALFLMIVFGIFEFGLIMALKNGNKAGLFYGTRTAMTNPDVTMDMVRSIIINKHQDYAFGQMTVNDIQITRYDSLNHRHLNIDPHIQANENTLSAGVYLYKVTSPYAYLTNFFKPIGSIAQIQTAETVINEPF